MGRRNGESAKRNNDADSFCRGRGGSSGRRECVGEAAAAPGRASEGRRRSGSLTGWAHRSTRDGRKRTSVAMGRLGGRRWAIAGLENKRGGWAKTISRAEIK
jgi:hypothetical protein